MNCLNLSKVTHDVKCEMKKWQTRKLSPFGRISILKTLIIPKFIHLFTTLTIPDKILSEIRTLLFKFIWSNKPDKVKRDIVCTNYMKGGLNMIEINDFVKSLKVNWMKRLFQSDCQWVELFIDLYGSLNRICLGDLYYNNLIASISNPFWVDVFKNWQTVIKKQDYTCKSDILNSCIWYNSKISKECLYYPTWFQRGIVLVGDIISSDGKIYDVATIEKIYNMKINLLEFFRVKLLVKKFIEKNAMIYRDPYNYIKPSIPCHVQILLKAKKGCQVFYKTFRHCVDPTAKIKWNNLVDMNQEEFWRAIYKICFKSVQDNDLIWLQYMIIQNILPTNYFLYKANLKQDNSCQLCGNYPETILHLLSDCTKVKELWKNLLYWIKIKTGIHLNLTQTMKVLGYTKLDTLFWPLNCIMIVVRKYIFSSSRKNPNLNIYFLQQQIQKTYFEQKLLADINGFQPIFTKKWCQWQNLFQ